MILTTCIVVGIVGLGLLGMSSRRSTSMADWTVSGRGFKRWTSWFLQAGDSLTTFSFLGLAGIAFGGGVVGVFVLAYLSISSIGMYFVGPRMRQLGQDRGYLTQADFFADRFGSRTLGKLTALVGAIFLLPYLQLQITGLGLIVELATGSAAGRGLSMVVASALVAIFVVWSGIRGIARVAAVKDILMILALLIVMGGAVFGIAGIPDTFAHIESVGPQLLDFSQTGWDTTFFLTVVIVTSIGAGLNTFPHLWPPVLAAKTGEVLRSNYKWLALYQLMLLAPIFVGFSAIQLLPPTTSGNHVLLDTANATLPSWLVAVVAIAGASAAMVPAAAIVAGISALVSNNLITIRNESRRRKVNTFVVVAAVLLSLSFGLAGSDIASLLLLTYGGLTQMAPATLIALRGRVTVGAVPVVLGLVVGVATVAWITFFEVSIGSWDSGLIALAPNVLVLLVAEAYRRRTREDPNHSRRSATSIKA